jgi:hypothetical protein
MWAAVWFYVTQESISFLKACDRAVLFENNGILF